MENNSVFALIKSYVLLVVLFIFPLFFLPITQEFFITNKLYLLSFGALLLLVVSTVEFVFTKKFSWKKGLFDNALLLFIVAVGLSTLISAPNKSQALLNPSLGLLTVGALSIVYFYISRAQNVLKKYDIMNILSISALVASVIAIVFYYQPFKAASLPYYLSFLKNPTFNTMGGLLDLALFLGFFLVYHLVKIYQGANSNKKTTDSYIYLSALTVGLGFLVYTLVQQHESILLPPYRLSWYAGVEILKNPLTALFGVGVDNFSAIFTRVKDLVYNQSPLWQVNFFNTSRSGVLHILTETGLFGIVSFILLIGSSLKFFRGQLTSYRMTLFVPFVYLMAVLILFPLTLPLLFLLFVILGIIAEDSLRNNTDEARSFNVGSILPFYIGTVVVSFVVIASLSFFVSKTFVAEYYFKRSIDAIAQNSARDLYENQRQALLTNSSVERFHINFAQTNLLIANNLANSASKKAGSANKQAQLSEQDRQTISQAIQTAIQEAKAAVVLNPQRASNWENLAVIYRNILNVAQGADVWTVSAYQRAIVLDPQNPVYRLNLGGIFYSLQNYADAGRMFEQATSLKPDWSNAHYNLAWASYQTKDYQRAAQEMQSVISLLDPKKDKTDYERAQKDLEEFKKHLPKETADTTQTGATKELTLPETVPTGATPAIKVPNGEPPTVSISPEKQQ